MNFICSVNEAVVPYLHEKTGKIEIGGNFSAFNQNWRSVQANAEQIKSCVGAKAGLCAWHLRGGKRTQGSTGVIVAGLIIVDIDNQADGKGPNGEKLQKQELT